MNLLIRNIKTLVQCETTPKQKVSGKDMSQLNCIDDAFLLIENDLIKDFGKEGAAVSNLKSQIPDLREIDASGKFVFPSWCDSHTHIVYAASRENEFVDRLKGLSYIEIARRGGGILN